MRRVERGATPRRLASELGSQSNSASAVPPLPASMLKFSGQRSGQRPAAGAEQAEPASSVQAAQPALGSAAAGSGQLAAGQQQQQPPASQLPAMAPAAGAGAAVGAAAAAAAALDSKRAEDSNRISQVCTLMPTCRRYSLPVTLRPGVST